MRNDMEHPDQELLSYFTYEHLPDKLKAISKPFGDLAAQTLIGLPECHQRTLAFQKLLEAKDCAVRAQLKKSE